MANAPRPDFATDWPRQLAELVEDCLSSGELEATDLRSIILAPTQDRQRLAVWLGVEWSNHPYLGDPEQAAGFLSLSPWLDEVDQMARGELSFEAPNYLPRLPLNFEDPARQQAWRGCWGRLYQALRGSAEALGTVHLAGRFTQPVGVFVGMGEEEARLVAFCHAQGAPLLPLSEQRKEHGYGSNYPQGALSEEGLVVFYPEGEGESFAEGGVPAIRSYPFAQMQRVTINDDGEVHVRFRGEVFDVRFEAGHTHEEHGGLDRAGVNAALSAHFQKCPSLVDPEALYRDLPSDVAGLKARLSQFSEDHHQSSALSALAERHGVAKVLRLADECALGPAILSRAYADGARHLLKQGKAAEAMEYLGRLRGEDRRASLEARAQTALGRWSEVLEAADDGSGSAPYRALALASLGRLKEAQAIVKAETRDEDLLAVRAILQARQRDPAAVATLREAYSEGTLATELLERVRQEPALEGVAAERDRAEEAWGLSRAELKDFPVSPLPSKGAPACRATPVRAWAPPLEAPAPEAEQKAKKGGSKKTKPEAKPRKWRCGLQRGQVAWLGDNQGAVDRVDESGQVRTLGPFFAQSVDAIVSVPGGVVVSDGTRLVLVDEAGQEQGRAWPFQRGSGPVTADGRLVARASNFGPDSVQLYWAEAGLTMLGTFGLPEGERVKGLSLAGARLAVLTERSLWLFDLSDPRRPRPEWRGQANGSFSWVGADGDLLACQVEDQLLLYRLEAEPRLLFEARLEGQGQLVRVDENRVGILARGQLWSIDPARPERAELELLFGVDGYPLEARHLISDPESPKALTEDGLVQLSQVSLDVRAVEQRVERESAQLVAWLAERCAAHLAEQPGVGSLEVFWFDGFARLMAKPPLSLPCLNVDPLWGDELRLESGEAAQQGGEPSPAAAQMARTLGQAVERIAQQRRALALSKMITALGRSLAKTVQARELAVLRYDSGGGREVVVAVFPGAGSEAQARAVITPRAPKTTRARLESYSWYLEREALTMKARRDPSFRAEILAILAEGSVLAAARIIEDLGQADAAVIDAWLQAAQQDPSYALSGLLQFPADPRVKAQLNAWAELDDPVLALPCRRALGRLDEDRTVELLERYLARLGQPEEESMAIPSETLAALPQARLVRLAPALTAARLRLKAARDSGDELLVPLARAGVWDPESLAAALRERTDEALGDGWLPNSMLDGEKAALTALRYEVARRIEEQLKAPDDGAPIWPSEIPIESHRGSWQRFFELAWPIWNKAQVLDLLHERLPSRAMAPKVVDEDGESHLAPDTRFALQVLVQDLLRGDLRAEALGRALESAPYEGNALKDVIKLARLSRVQYGWSLSKEQRYAEARQVADAALADGPDDGQVLFFDARLAWLERNDPQEALRRIPRALEKAGDAEGRGRLYNLYGAALDAQGEYQASIGWFEKAMGADPSQTAMFLSNIAEAHWKLGAQPEARAFAEKAVRQGSTTDIVKTILATPVVASLEPPGDPSGQ